MITCTKCGKTWDSMESCVEDDSMDFETFERIDDDESESFDIECCKCTGKKCSWQ